MGGPHKKNYGNLYNYDNFSNENNSNVFLIYLLNSITHNNMLVEQS